MASRSVNKVILVGNLGRNAETQYTQGGVPRTTFSVATSRRWKDQQTGEWKEETEWHNVGLWRQENIKDYLTKGRQVYVEGRLQTRAYEAKDGSGKRYSTVIVADDVLLLGGRGDAPAPEENQTASSGRGPSRAAPLPEDEPPPDLGPGEDDVPF